MATDTTLSLRPVFVCFNVLATRLWLLGYIAAICGVAGGILTSLRDHTGNAWPGFIAFGAFGFFVVAPLGVYAVNKMSYARTEYRFYADRLEFEEGFFVVKKKTILFRDVDEVTLQKSVSQRICRLGTINLSTAASEMVNPSPFAKFGFTGAAASGAIVQDIPDPDEAFAAIEKMVDACRGERPDQAGPDAIRSEQHDLAGT